LLRFPRGRGQGRYTGSARFWEEEDAR
jgi:hypothetical protein